MDKNRRKNRAPPRNTEPPVRVGEFHSYNTTMSSIVAADVADNFADCSRCQRTEPSISWRRQFSRCTSIKNLLTETLAQPCMSFYVLCFMLCALICSVARYFWLIVRSLTFLHLCVYISQAAHVNLVLINSKWRWCYRRCTFRGWLASRVVSMLDSGAVGPGFKSQLRHCRVTVLCVYVNPAAHVNLLLINENDVWMMSTDTAKY